VPDGMPDNTPGGVPGRPLPVKKTELAYVLISVIQKLMLKLNCFQSWTNKI